MFDLLRGVGETLVGLVVEDGQLAIGIVAALALVWIVATTSAAALDISGWLLLALLMTLLATNLVLTARRAKRRVG